MPVRVGEFEMTSEEHEPQPVTGGRYVNPTGELDRDMNYITTRITADGRDGYPVSPGRYRLVVARACPWAHRPQPHPRRARRTRPGGLADPPRTPGPGGRPFGDGTPPGPPSFHERIPPHHNPLLSTDRARRNA